MELYQNNLGKRIRHFRSEQGWTQAELGERTGKARQKLGGSPKALGQDRVAAIEGGRSGISMEMLFALSIALEVQPGSLLAFPVVGA